MVNRPALGYLAGVLGSFIIAAKSFFTILKVRGTPEAGQIGVILFLLIMICLCFAITCSAGFAISLRNYPGKYIPSGRYLVLWAYRDWANVLVALNYRSDPADKHPAKHPMDDTLGRTRLFFVPVKWFMVDDRAVNHTVELVCQRVKGHPIISVSSDFHKKYCHIEKLTTDTQAA